jgi:hypothetical protein
MVEWFLPSRRDVVSGRGGVTVARTELTDPLGAQVVVETRRIDASIWETTVTPGDAPDPDGPDALIFATVDSASESLAAHEQAVEFSADALNSTLRRVAP